MAELGGTDQHVFSVAARMLRYAGKLKEAQ